MKTKLPLGSQLAALREIVEFECGFCKKKGKGHKNQEYCDRNCRQSAYYRRKKESKAAEKEKANAISQS